ncbi:MAG: hypothetical protein P0Y56_11315 [Candidatus Andeanibacterium colombiense]|uniref:Phage gp6-like head-tail connector protein n=1 Tax=Candidatus Andeanibacterium colombiense TaxID=3121345 RepID=A0AAJ5X4U9_9SPHN|nr:MAG: hypothetical protein P0Y56_11315 [Sphingomonadaceae bacterium]
MRTILTPPAVPDAALGALKAWLAISTASEDAALTALLAAALDACEAFTGLMVLESTCEEVLPAQSGWQALATKPVQTIAGAEGIPAEGASFALAADAYAIDLDADGGGRFRLIGLGSAGRVAVRFTAGLAAEWDDVPAAIRHGTIRLAAQLYRRRDDEADSATPPASVAALWRPWRRLHLT